MLKTATPILASLNAEETIKFYTEKLGFTFHNNWDGYIILSKDEISIHLWPTNDESIPKNTGCYIYVTAVDELYVEYTKQDVVHPNGKLKNMPWGMRQFSILDNSGNIIHFGEDISEKA
ncbi:VOC family protein [Pedobacter psychrodurus]|uniref:Bleomycin resistance protein n=1 Tax=Pedobacter psychrodurus TaxID=2530456 RepID=A0A4R0Q7K4_9SPHI|nr:VOC family protein [Pedobacter psychrodurus]TCD27477.1 VOC family protein [Pedobacter psychrodurus]